MQTKQENKKNGDQTMAAAALRGHTHTHTHSALNYSAHKAFTVLIGEDFNL